MTKATEDAGKFGKEAVDSGLKSLAAVSKGAQAIAAETGEYVKKSFEDGQAAWQQIVQAKSIEKALQVQTGYTKSAYEGFVAEITKLSGLYADMAKEAFKPFEGLAARTK